MNLPIQAFNDDHEQMSITGGTQPVPDMQQIVTGIIDQETARQNESLAEWTNS